MGHRVITHIPMDYLGNPLSGITETVLQSSQNSLIDEGISVMLYSQHHLREYSLDTPGQWICDLKVCMGDESDWYIIALVMQKRFSVRKKRDGAAGRQNSQ